MTISENESGRSLIEMLAVISVISMITVGSISAMNYGLQAYRANASYDLVESTAQRVSDLYSWMKGYPNDSASMKNLICNNDIFDSDCIGNESVATAAAPWGQIKIEAGDETAFRITLTDVPQRGCEQLKQMGWRYVQPVGNTTWNQYECQPGENDIVMESY